MSDDLTPDPFDEQLGARLHEAADGIDGAGVDRAGIAAAVDRDRRRQTRARSLVVGAAAAIAVLGGLAVATQMGGDGDQHVQSAGTTTVPCAGGSIDDPAGWFRVADDQVEVLVVSGAITSEEAAGRADHPVRLTYRELEELVDPPVGPIGEQIFQLGYEDSAGVSFLRERGLLTEEQEASDTDGITPVLRQEQVDALFQQFPGLVAWSVGGEPYRASGTPPYLSTTTTASVAATSTPEGGTPFDEWAAYLRGKGLLTPDQEADIAAGRGFSLTPEQSAAMQEHWDEQAAASSTTGPSFAPADPPSTTVPDPCASDITATTDGPHAGPTTTTTAVVTTTVPATTTTAAPEVTTTTSGGAGGPAVTTTTVDPRRPAGWPASLDPNAIAPGDVVWAVYVDAWAVTDPNSGTPTTTAPDGQGEVAAGEDRWWAAEARVSSVGYLGSLVGLDCEPGVRSDSYTLETGPNQAPWAFGVYFATQADAQRFSDLLPGSEAGISQVRRDCQG